jgi:flavin reductase (DIM6/NTAB) family NADH-FMN oxidoreductase RutF
MMIVLPQLYRLPLTLARRQAFFVVNTLAHDQIELSNKFARTHENKFAEIDHMIAECGAPVLIGAAAHFECRNEYRHYGGDHIIFIGHVERCAYTGKPTLLFCRGKYMRGRAADPTLTRHGIVAVRFRYPSRINTANSYVTLRYKNLPDLRTARTILHRLSN